MAERMQGVITMGQQNNQQDVQVLDYEEMLQFVERKLAEGGMKVGRQEIITILEAEEAFLIEKGVIEEIPYEAD